MVGIARSPHSLVYIPTNRLATDAMADALQECRWATEHGHGSPIFVLIEHNVASEISSAHRRFLEDASHAGPWLHLDESRTDAFVDQLLHRLDENETASARLRDLLLPRGVSYGRGPNLAALVGQALGVTILHRRDSDVYIDDMGAGPPIELELLVAGKRLADLTDVVGCIDEFRPAERATVQMVGTNSLGAPPFDRRDLIAAGREFLVDFQALGRPGVDRDSVAAEVHDYFFREPSLRYPDDLLQIDVDNRVEMQSCASAGVHAVLPEMPTDIIGCDYMAKDVLWRCGEGLVYHSRKGQHRYSPEREAQTDLHAHVSYVLRDVQYLQFGRLWQIHSDNLAAYWETHRGLEAFDAPLYAESFAAAAGVATAEMAEVRTGAERVFSAAADVSSGVLQDRLGAVARRIHAAGPALEAHVVRAVEDYCFLVPRWASLIAAAAQASLPTNWVR